MRINRYLIWIVGAILGLALLATASLYWASRSETLLRWGVDRFGASLPCSLLVDGMRGAFMEPLAVDRIVCESAEFRVEAHNLALVWSPLLLVTSGQVEVLSLRAGTVSFTSKSTNPEPGRPPTEFAAPDEIGIPVDIDINLVEIGSIAIVKGSTTTEFNDLSASYKGGKRSHRLTLHRVTSEWGQAQAEVSVGASAPLPVSATVHVESGYLEAWPVNADLQISGELRRLTVNLQGSAGALPVTGTVELAPFDPDPIVSITASTADVDAANFDSRFPHTTLSALVQAQLTGTSVLTGTLRVENSETGSLDEQRLPVQVLDTDFELDMNSSNLSNLNLSDPGLSKLDGPILRLPMIRLDLGPAGHAEGSAEIAPTRTTLLLDVSRLNLKAAHADLNSTSLAGSMSIDHHNESQVVTIDLRQKGMHLESRAEVTPERVNIVRMTASAGGAQLRATGSVDLNEQLTYAIDGTLQDFDPARFGDFPQAGINGTLQARGNMRPQWLADVKYNLGRSQISGVPLSGNGKLQVTPSLLRDADMQLDYGGNALKLTGSFGTSGDALTFTLNAQRLDRLDKKAAGRLQASGTLTGTLKRPAVNAQFQAREIGYEQFRIAGAEGKILVEQDDDPAIRGQIRLQQFARGEFTLDAVDASIDGTLSAHRVDIAVAAPDTKVNSRIEGGWTPSQRLWSGVIGQLENKGTYPITMTRPATLELAQDHVVVGETEVQFNATELNLGETRYQDGRLLTKGTISGVRATRILALMEDPPAIESTLVLDGHWEIRADEAVNGIVEFTRTNGDIVFPGDEPLALELKDMRVTLRAVANQITAEGLLRSAQVDAQASARTRVEKRGANWGIPGTAPLNLESKLEMKSIRPIAAMASRSVIADGSLKFNVNGKGTVAKPQLTGTVEGDKLKIEDVAKGVFFRDGRLRASFTDNALTLTELKLMAGEGELTASGQFSAHKGVPIMDLQWAASKLQVIQHPELRLTVSGSGQFAYTDATVSLNGELTTDQGRVELRNRTMPSLGDDVVITGRETRSKLSEETKNPNLDLKLDLGSDFTVVGRGLDAIMAGQIRLASGADKPLAVEGEIRVASGTFEAYGRRLQIEQGILYFAGPVTNPGINIRAMRKNQPVEAGVEITGTARDPRVRLVSNPDVSDPDKLAWLVLGRQAESRNAQDNNALQSSAAALAAGLGTSPFQRQLAQAVGVDEINYVPGDGQEQGGVVAVGKQVSNKVYVTQEFGLNAAGNTLRVSYQLTRRWSVRTESGDTDAVDLFFTLSFD